MQASQASMGEVGAEWDTDPPVPSCQSIWFGHLYIFRLLSFLPFFWGGLVGQGVVSTKIPMRF